MKNKLHWVRWFPSDFLHGTSTLNQHECTVYIKVLMSIYDKDGPIPHDPEGIARLCNMRLPQCRSALEKLIKTEKLSLVGGKLSNERCEREIHWRRGKQEQASRNANKRWKKALEKTNEINGRPMQTHSDSNATAMPILEATDYNLETKKNDRASLRSQKEPNSAIQFDSNSYEPRGWRQAGQALGLEDTYSDSYDGED